jgi:membrane-associated protease RseP (regulator of RpoE activity)
VTDSALVPPDADGRPNDNAKALARLGVVVVGGVALAVLLHALAVLVVVVSLVAMVMLHELGHFATAKWSKMKVTEYFFGFGPKLWSVRRGETEYGVKAIPAGGYVRIVGMTNLEVVDEVDEPRSYRQASFPARLAVAVAGSTMHFILALVLIFCMLVTTGFPTTVPGNEVTGLSASSTPAARAHIVSGDQLVGFNGHRASINATINAIRATPDRPISVLVAHDGTVRPITVRPITRAEGGIAPAGTAAGRQGFIGVELDGVRSETTGVLPAVARTGSLFGSVVVSSFVGIGDVFSFHGLRNFFHQVATASSHGQGSSGASGNSGLISIVGAVQIGAQAASHDPAGLLYLLVAINIFVGIVNLFPMLPLDGGHVVIAVYERVRTRRGKRYHADVRKLMPIAYVFLAFIIMIGVGALYSNIVNPL